MDLPFSSPNPIVYREESNYDAAALIMAFHLLFLCIFRKFNAANFLRINCIFDYIASPMALNPMTQHLPTYDFSAVCCISKSKIAFYKMLSLFKIDLHFVTISHHLVNSPRIYDSTATTALPHVIPAFCISLY